MSQGWSNISISIKSDLLAKLLRDHGITPKGAGNVKYGITYDVDFEWEYSSRYEHMAQDISSVGDLILYYITCVLAVENGKELKTLEKAYVQNMDAINNSVECAYYRASVWWDIVANGEKSFEFKLDPAVKKAQNGMTIFDDPQASDPSWNRWFCWLGEWRKDQESIKQLESRGWGFDKIFDGNRGYFDEYGISARYCVVCDQITRMADNGEIDRVLQAAIDYRKKYEFLLVREADFLAMGDYRSPACNHTIPTLSGKNVAVLGEFTQLTYNKMKKTVTDRGGITTSKLKKDSDYLILADDFRMISDEMQVVYKAEQCYAKSGKPMIMSESQYLQQLAAVEAVAPQPKAVIDPGLPLAGKIFVLANYDGQNKALAAIKKLIADNGGIIRKSVSSKTDYVICKHFGMQTWTEWKVVNGVNTKITHEYEASNITEAKKLSKAGAKVELILEDDFLARFGDL